MKKTSFVSYIQVGLLAALVYGASSFNEKLEKINAHFASQSPETVYEVVGRYHDEWTSGFVLKGNQGYRTVTYDRGSWFDNMPESPKFVQVIDYRNGKSPSVYPVVMTK